MSFTTQTFRGRAELSPATTPTIYNLVSPVTADTEFSQAIDSGTKRFMIRCREGCDIKLAFTSGDSGSNYITIPACSSYSESNVNLEGVTLYMQLPKAGQTIEIITWS